MSSAGGGHRGYLGGVERLYTVGLPTTLERPAIPPAPLKDIKVLFR